MPTRAELFARKNRIIALYRAGRGMQEIDNLLGLYGGCTQKTLNKWAPEIIRTRSEATTIGAKKRPPPESQSRKLYDPWANEARMQARLFHEQDRARSRREDHQTRGVARSR